MTTITAKVVLDSISEEGKRLTTIHMHYPRAIHAELMTHRVFCLSRDSVLTFDLPKGSKGYEFRKHEMTIREFVNKWYKGVKEHKTSRGNGIRTFSIKNRLMKMKIRQLNEDTGMIQHSTVKNCVFSGNKEVFKLKAGIHEIVATKDHRILTQDGWKRLEEIVPQKDYVVVQSYEKFEWDKIDPYEMKRIDGRWRNTWQNQIRPIVFKEQHNKCFECDNIPEDIHHIIPVYKDKSLAFERSNVVGLCKSCHIRHHEIQGWQGGMYLYGENSLVDEIVFVGEVDTYDLEIEGDYENFLANGIVVHNSRNARSSRAVPVSKIIQEVIDDPFIPLVWGKNQKGMQSSEECNELIYIYGDLPEKFCSGTMLTNEQAWLTARDQIVDIAKGFDKAGYHKQIVNRLLEPWAHIDTLVTSTEWDNFFGLRCHEAAEPHMEMLANAVYDAMQASTPKLLKFGQWHLPYLTSNIEDHDFDRIVGSFGKELEIQKKLSTARCARISYEPFDGDGSIEAELKRYDLLVGSAPVHASPAEHQGTPDYRINGMDVWAHQKQHGNFVGWIQNRKLIPNENISKYIR